MKTCKSCKSLKPLSEYSPAGRMKDGHINKCKSCIATYHRNRAQKKKEVSDGVFNVDMEMKWVMDETPNHLYTGETRTQRMRIDHTIALDQKFNHTTFTRTA